VRTNKYLKSFLEEFREIEVNFAIDDFGSGFSNFSLILEIAPDFIKIDGSLIKNIDTDNNSYELVKSIVAFSHALGKKTIAEFVHSKEIFEIAKSLQVDLFQGYYFSEPKIDI
jgi:EAL domain-containing protein (putative c-di-GMP-specific phosphodiesterase class I)